MVWIKFKLLSIFFLLLIIVPSAVAVDYPSRDGNVNDFADMLDPDEEAQLNSDIISLEEKTTIEIVIVTVESLQGVSIEEYAVNLFKKWGIGKKGKDNGLLILFAKNEREYRTEVGYGLEGTITDAESSRIGHSILEPNFKRGEYGEGLHEAVLEVKGLVSNNPDVVAKYVTKDNNKSISSTGIDEVLVIVLILSILIILITRTILFFISYEKRKIEKKNYLFRWSRIPGADDGLLTGFLERNFSLDWEKITKIEKLLLNGNSTIRVSSEINNLLLKLNDKKNRVNLIIDNNIIDELHAIANCSTFCVYKKNTILMNYITYSRIAWRIILGSTAIVLIAAYLIHIMLFVVVLFIIIVFSMYSLDVHTDGSGGFGGRSKGGGGSRGGGFGGGRSGGGGHSGKW